jgi:hypothetical protein
MAFKFYIDGQLTDQPNNDTDMVTTVKRDNQLKGLIRTQDIQLEWTQNNDLNTGEISGYAYLDSVFQDGICNEVEIEIYDYVSPSETNLVYKGIIKLTQLEYDEQKVNIKTKIQDNSFYAYIFNNKDIKVNLNGNYTKSQVPLTPIQPYQIDLFMSDTGIYGSTVGMYFRGYRIYDVMAFIILAITDGKVAFSSTYLEGLEYHPMLIKGQAILNPYTIYPTAEDPLYEISFQECFNELDKIKNLSFYIDNTDPANPILRVEDTESLFTANGGITFTDIKELKTTVDINKLYGQVRVGTTKTIDGQDPVIYTFNEATSYYGWKIETFFPLGQCNTSTELNLINDWVLSNNVIMDTAIGQSTSNVDDYFLIECDTVDTIAFTALAHRYEFFGQAAPPYFYNFGLNNYNKLQRHSDKFETAFGSFLGIGSNGFRALQGDDPTNDKTYNTGSTGNPNFIPPGGLVDPAEYVNETTNGGYDGNNNYSNIAYEYVVPVDGNYSFSHNMLVEANGLAQISGGDYFSVSPFIFLNGVSVSTSPYTPQIFSNAIYNIVNTAVCNCVAGDIITAKYGITYFPNGQGNQQNARQLTVIWKSFFECNGTPDGGVSITSGNTSIKKLIHEFEYFINETDWRTIEANITSYFPFEKDGVTRLGWIEELNHNNWTGRTKVKLITENATT